MRRLFFIGWLCLLPVGLLAQAADENSREFFDEGIYFFSREDYGEAAYYFRRLLENHPDNSHYNFLLGESYLNIPGSESLAVPFLEKATKSTVEKNKYRGRDYGEDDAPLHAWFYLGNAYRISGRLDDALHAYSTFVNSPYYYGNYNLTVVENEIKSCERAKIIMDSPIDVVFEKLDSTVNSTSAELHVVVSKDEQSMVFIRRLKFYDAILWTTKSNGVWGQPVNLNPLVGSDGEFYPVYLSRQGDELYLVKAGNVSSDIFVSYFRNGTWTKAEMLNRHINTLADETSACLSADSQTLWFTSARKGGAGGLDIYYAHRDNNGQWGKARNAGKTINTPFDEESPYLCNHDEILFFSSRGHYTMGGYDVFFASRDGKTWKTPVNIGYPISNTADNKGYVPVQAGKAGYIAVINDKDGTAEDIFRVVLKSHIPAP